MEKSPVACVILCKSKSFRHDGVTGAVQALGAQAVFAGRFATLFPSVGRHVAVGAGGWHEISAVQADGCRFVCLSDVARTIRGAGQGDVLKMILMEHGTDHFTQDGFHAMLDPRCLLLYRPERPFIFTSAARCGSMIFQAPIDLLPSGLRGACDRPRVLGDDDGLAALVMDMMRRAARMQRMACDSRAEGARAVRLDALRDAMGNLIGTLPDLSVTGGRQAVSHGSVLHRAEAFILRHLSDPALDVGRIVAALGCSRRGLYRAFALREETPERHILRCRLECCHHALRDPGFAHMTLEGIASLHGFSSAAHFSRSFRMRYGRTPSEVRAESISRKQVDK